MKNLIIALSLFFAVGVNAQAKKRTVKTVTKTPVKEVVVNAKLSNEEMAKKNVADLAAFTPLTEQRKADFLGLFTTKYKMLNENGALSEERKQIIYTTIERKLEGSLDGAAFEKLKANTVLFKSLTR